MSREIKTVTDKILLYSDKQGKMSIEVLFRDETFWMTQKLLSQLFKVDRSVISKHLKNIFGSGELIESSVCAKNAHTASDGKIYNYSYYNLDVIISVGYRVNSKEATRFRKWSTKVLRDYIIKGFVLDDELLKNGRHFGKDYFDELLERIREIRATERRFYLKLTDLFAEASFDYDKSSEIARKFYSVAQNKLHWAITGKTAAEIIYERADAEKPNMGLTSWKESPKGKVHSYDIDIAKNYLAEEEIEELNRLVNMLLDYAELTARHQQLMSMEDWAKELNRFLEFNRYNILDHSGQVSAELARKKANLEYQGYKLVQDKIFKSDFEQLVEQTIKKDS